MASDEARYVEQEERAAKRIADDDPDYEDTSIKSRQSKSTRLRLPLVIMFDILALEYILLADVLIP
jgi:hypothetical protein